jgi:hypothetical protein
MVKHIQESRPFDLVITAAEQMMAAGFIPFEQKKPDCACATVTVVASGNPADLAGKLMNAERSPSPVNFPSPDHSRFGKIIWH